MPELTVAMPACNRAAYIGEALANVLRQRGVDFEVIVVDDGSEDGTAALVESLQDSRIRLLRNDVRRGIGFCHNLIIRNSRAPFIIHVDSDDIVYKPDAFAKMLETMRSSDRIGQAHCHFIQVDAQGRLLKEAFHQHRQRLLNGRRPGMDYRWHLLAVGTVINALRTYRKEVFTRVGGFNENLAAGEDWEMALRIVEHYEIALVPEFLYAVRKHGRNTSESGRFQDLSSWWMRVRECNRLVRSGAIRFPTEDRYHKNRLLLIGLWRLLGLRRYVSGLRGCLIALKRAGKEALWRSARAALSWWPLAAPPPSRVTRGEDVRVAYFHHAFPLLSETFIQREVLALRRAGLAVKVFSLYRAEPGTLDETAQSLALGTHYLEPGELNLRSAAVRQFLRRCPLTCAKLFLYTLFRQHLPRKSWRIDLELFARALAFAVAAEEWGATQLHSPWASPDAFTALLASRLLGIPYTVHVRASDLHLPFNRPGLVERLRHASHIVTNSEYNERILIEMLSPFRWPPPILRVYNGLDLLEYRPIAAPQTEAGPPLLLSVGRIIEAKGFEHLLRACAVLKEQGRAFRCEIIGEIPKEAPNYFLQLLKLRRALRLEGEVEFAGAALPGRVRVRYAEAALFVLPAVIAPDGTGDVTPNVVIEAMATGLPVISTRSRAIPELVEDGVSGLLVEPGDGNALAAAITKVLDNPELAWNLGRNARTRVEQRFDINRNTRKLLALFRGELDHGEHES